MSRRGAHDIPPPLELECLSVLWRLGESNVRTVQETLATARPLAYTTVMTMLERLARKQLVGRRKTGRNFVYTAQVERDTVRLHAVRNLLDALFDASPAQLRAFLDDAAQAEQPSAQTAMADAAQAAAASRGIEAADEDTGDNDIDAVLL